MPRGRRPLNVARSLGRPAGRKWEVALALLSDAARYAEEVGCNAWEFAVEIDALMEAGLTKNDLRWLRYVGHVSNAVETTSRSARRKRTFAQRDPVIFSPRTCFVATATGLELAQTHFAGALSSNSSSTLPAVAVDGTPAAQPTVPRWNRSSRTLHLGNILVKEFKVPAANQELVLSAFQEECWPPHIDDPLPPSAGLDAKRRLHHTINRLNHNQQHRLIRFLGNGNGRAIRWEPV